MAAKNCEKVKPYKSVMPVNCNFYKLQEKIQDNIKGIHFNKGRPTV